MIHYENIFIRGSVIIKKILSKKPKCLESWILMSSENQ